jgi:CheY-like chemotaxis protein
MTPANPSARISVLVVDDDVDTCNNLSDILTDLGYDVDIAHDGPSALARVRTRAYDVALLDYMMPGMDGLTLFREIRKLQSSAVAMVVTAYAGGGVAERALEEGVWQVVNKPVQLPALLGLVQQAVEQPLVLVVDDDTDLCANLYDLFRERGYRVGLAHNEVEVNARLHSQAFKVVLIDMRLPGGDGTSVFRRVRAALPEARTVVITGFPGEMNPLIQKMVAEGADAVCYKPFDVPKLLAILDQLARSHGTGGFASPSPTLGEGAAGEGSPSPALGEGAGG